MQNYPQISSNDTSRLNDFYRMQYDALRREIEQDSAYQRDLEKYCVAGLAAYMVWLPDSHLEYGGMALSVGLSILIGLVWLRAYRCRKSVERIASYNSHIESMFYSGQLKGWENWLKAHRSDEEAKHNVKFSDLKTFSEKWEKLLYMVSKTKNNATLFWSICIFLCYMSPLVSWLIHQNGAKDSIQQISKTVR